jgi:phosphatidylinositol phospholipase C gamma-1
MTVTLQEFQNFLLSEQQDYSGNNGLEVSQFIREYLQDPQRDIQKPYFYFSEFIDFLFSKQNEIWDNKFDQVFHDMTRPMSHYWIASSHNT